MKWTIDGVFDLLQKIWYHHLKKKKKITIFTTILLNVIRREKVMDTFEIDIQLYFLSICVKVVNLFVVIEKLHLLV